MRIKIYLCLLLILVSLPGWAQSPSSIQVHFAFDKWELTTSSKATLDSLTDSLDIADRIELHGHCDAIGGNAYNDQLSAKRVQAVNKYLLSIGWERQDIKVVQAHGKNIPLNKNLSPEERSLNRRVEIKIIHAQGNKGKSLTEKLADSTLTTGTNIVLRNINFVGGMHQFLRESAPMLVELLDAMNAYPKLVIRIEGHICCNPSPGDGLDLETAITNLSEARAKAVKDYLVRNDIAPDRVFYKGFGHSSPIYPYPEKTEEERTQNRRVEIKIISK
jgi:outer membrane protein OmpA-like peptidoglycan-associated protein